MKYLGAGSTEYGQAHVLVATVQLLFTPEIITHTQTYTDTQIHRYTNAQRQTLTHTDANRNTQTRTNAHRHTHMHTQHIDTHL